MPAPRLLNTLLASLLLALFAVNAAAMDIPPEVAAEFPPYPGATVLQVIQVEDTTIVMLDCGAADMDDVAAHYNRILDQNGYSIVMTNSYPGGMVVLAEKGDLEVTLDLGDADGSTQLSLSVSGDIPEAAAQDAAEAARDSGDPLGLDAEMATAMPHYPDSTLLQSMDTGEGLLTILDCGSASVQEVYDFYKANLVDNGYAIDSEAQLGGSLTLAASKDSFKAVVDVSALGETTMARLALTSTGQPAASQDGVESDDTMREQDQVEEQSAGTAPDSSQDTSGSFLNFGLPAASGQSPLWDYVAARPGDGIKDEYSFMSAFVVSMASPSPFVEVLDYYEQALTADGWESKMRVIEGEGGMATLAKGDLQFMISSDEDVPDNGQYGYTLVLEGLR